MELPNRQDLIALRDVFDNACKTLGLRTNAEDNRRRAQLAEAIVTLVAEGETDAVAIHEHVVRLVKGGV